VFNRRLSDFRRELIDDQIVESFVLLAKVPHRREAERDYLEQRWADVSAQVDFDDLVQHRRDPVVRRADAEIVEDARARTREERSRDHRLYEELGWALGTLVWNARRQAEWVLGSSRQRSRTSYRDARPRTSWSRGRATSPCF